MKRIVSYLALLLFTIGVSAMGNQRELYNTDKADWQAQWIASDVTNAIPYFAKDFKTSNRVRKATLRASALGVMMIKLNGQPISKNRLEPGESQWDKTVLYCTYDVTSLLNRGNNRLLAKVSGALFNTTPAPGRYTKPEIKNNGTSAFLCQLDIEYDNGRRERITTDNSWLTAPSPTLRSNWWGGEDYDGRMEPKKNDWHAVKCIGPTTNLPIEQGRQNQIGQLRPQEHEPIQVVERWEAKSITRLPNGDYVVDFGQNFAGIFEFTLSGKRGQTLKLQTSEQLNPDGTVNAQDCYCGPIVVYDTYTFGNDEVTTWSPELMYHGFRYLQVSGLTSEPKVSQFKALRMRVSCDAIGHFETSNTLINQIHRMCRNSVESQLFHVFTDCPQREKMGWLDVPNQMYNSIALNFDFRRLGHKIVRDCFDAQSYYEGNKRGKVPSTVPHFFTDWDDDPNWGGSAILIPYRSWKTYGDRSLIDEYYDKMKLLADYYTSLTQDNLMPGASYSRLSDWGQESSGLEHKTTPEFTITCTYYYIQKVMAEMARLSEHDADALVFEQQAEKTRKSFNARFYNDTTAIYAHGNQAELAMPLYYGLTDTDQTQRVAERLAEKVISDGYKVKTGECGLKPVLMSLAQYGHNDIVWRMACQTDYPSYGYFVKNGCTTTPELWNMRYSQNHCMLDHIEEWFYTYLAGIQNVGTAYDSVTIQPYVPAGLDSLSASIKSPHGIRSSKYNQLSDGSVCFHFVVPQGCKTTIVLPNGKKYEVAAGEYNYTMKLGASTHSVLYIGDSITDGGWGRSGGSAKASKDRNHWDLNHVYGHSYMMFCAAYYQSQWPDAEWQFWNRGISGNTLFQLADRWQEDALDLKPDVISILIGTNDVGAYQDECKKLGKAFTVEDFDYCRWEKRYRKLLDTTSMVLPNVNLVLCTPFVGKSTGPGRMAITDSLAQIVRQIANDYNAVLVPFDSMFNELQKNQPTEKYWIWDGIHPTAAGHQRMAELWESECRDVMTKSILIDSNN